MPSQGTNFFVMAQKKNNNKNEMSVDKLKRPTKISWIKDFTSKTSKDWSEDSESDLKFSQSISSSYSCSLSDSSK